MKITEVYVLSDVLDSGPFEGEILYNKAYKYGRYDICLELAETKRKTAEFEENVRKYEETGEQQYKDKATGRYYHRLLCKVCPIAERAGQCSDAYFKFSTALSRGDKEEAIKYAEIMRDAWIR